MYEESKRTDFLIIGKLQVIKIRIIEQCGKHWWHNAEKKLQKLRQVLAVPTLIYRTLQYHRK